jgi:uridine kinase
MTIWDRDDGTPVAAPEVIAADLISSEPRLGPLHMLAIDGPAGSGKTTLAAAVSAQLEDHAGRRTAILHMDDFYAGWDDGMSDESLARVHDQVLTPLSEGRTARWQRYDWEAAHFAEWNVTPDCDVLILEGCGSGALPYARFIGVLVWIEVDPAARLRRGIERDGAEVESLWLEWMRREDAHFAAHLTRHRADLRLTS